MFLTGAACGAVAALLFTPRSGAELRSRAAANVAEAQRAVTEKVTGAVSDVHEAISRRLDVIDHTVKEGVAAFNEAREVFLDAPIATSKES